MTLLRVAGRVNHVKRRRWLLAVSLGWLACAPAQDELTAYFLAHGAQDPAVAAEDAYKYLYHAARGGEHALADETAAGLWLAREWATLGPPQPREELWEPLTADGRIGRLHLRPYKAQGGNKEALLEAFLAGARDFACGRGAGVTEDGIRIVNAIDWLLGD